VNLYEEAIKIWISRKSSRECWAEDIKEIKFGEDNWGACPTCDDPYMAIFFRYERNGKSKWSSIAVENVSPADMISECMEIYKTLSTIKLYEFQTVRND
jgi:hypothetical protein